MVQTRKKATTTYYQVLGISHAATSQEIRKAYHQLAKIYHPDTKVGLSDVGKETYVNRLKEINKAYAVLSHPKLRKHYDISLNQQVVPWLKPQAKQSANPFFSEKITETQSKGFLNRLCSSFYHLTRPFWAGKRAFIRGVNELCKGALTVERY